MKTMLIILGFSLCGASGAAFQDQEIPCCGKPGHGHDSTAIAEIYPEFEADLRQQGQTTELEASNIQVIQDEEQSDLGFDTAKYLPVGFDAYAGKIATWVDLGLIPVDEQQEVDLGFDTTPYLPTGFDPYEGMAPAWENISTEAIQAALFHTGVLAPSEAPAADLHPGNSVGLDALGLTEVEEETDLGFDTAAYLPAGFDPYQGMAPAGPAMQ